LNDKYKGIITISIVLLLTIFMFMIKSYVTDFQELGYVGAFIISLIGSATVIIPVPSWVIVFTMADVLNPVLLGLVVGIASALGETTGYLMGVGGASLVSIKNNKYFGHINSWLSNHSFWTLFLFSLIPNPFFDFAGLVAGASNISYKNFIIPVMIGKCLRFVILAILISVGYDIIQ